MDEVRFFIKYLIPSGAVYLVFRDAKSKRLDTLKIVLWSVATFFFWYLALPGYFIFSRTTKTTSSSLSESNKRNTYTKIGLPFFSFVLNLGFLKYSSLLGIDGSVGLIIIPFIILTFLTLPFAFAAMFISDKNRRGLLNVTTVLSLISIAPAVFLSLISIFAN